MRVSIPRRDFWVFQRSVGDDVAVVFGVSIPRRDFWVFQLHRLFDMVNVLLSFNP
ncbi:hypothetical protein CKA32_000670 [Geitlerinema sp. FC II]|nr:hypothetical protein CKA32_000670 [Geitlerinema sp. FC II]